MLETVMTIFVVGVLALAFIFTMTRGILQVHEERVEKEKLRVKRLESEVKMLGDDRRRHEEDADKRRFAYYAKLREDAMRELEELWRRMPTEGEEMPPEYWEGVGDGVKGALVFLGHAQSQRWEREKRVKEILDMVDRASEGEVDGSERPGDEEDGPSPANESSSE